jgi:mRNA-degrading endonuclease RelE of RelBE toxin-antitoxin system
VIFLCIFVRRFHHLHPRLSLQARRRLQELAENPYVGLRLVGELEGFWKDRVGKHRIIHRIDEPNKTLVFYDVDLRKRVYHWQTEDITAITLQGDVCVLADDET